MLLSNLKTLLLLILLISFRSFVIAQHFNDQDNDGIENEQDLDDDNDGIPDEMELKWGNPDIDGDGITNELDLDSDNDGIPDAVEASYADINGDGIVDGFMDENRDGWTDIELGVAVLWDADADGLPNFLDSDSDNDGYTDVEAAGGMDQNKDGRLDGFRDVDLDGLNDLVDGDIGNMLAPGDHSLTPSSSNKLPTDQYFRPLTRLARSCEDIDLDGLCDCFDGDIGNQLKPGQDFSFEEL